MNWLEIVGSIALYLAGTWAGGLVLVLFALKCAEDAGLGAIAIAAVVLKAWLALSAIVGLLWVRSIIGGRP